MIYRLPLLPETDFSALPTFYLKKECQVCPFLAVAGSEGSVSEVGRFQAVKAMEAPQWD